MLIERRKKEQKKKKDFRKHLSYSILKKNPQLFKEAIQRFRLKFQPRSKALAPVANLLYPCAAWMGFHDTDSYAMFSISDINLTNGQNYGCKTSHFIHYMIHRREVKKGHIIAHLCQQPWCVEPTHLLETTQGPNSGHARLNRKVTKPSNQSWKLTTPEVESILYLYYVLHYDITWIHKQFPHVNRVTIYNAIKGITYDVISIDNLIKRRK